MRVLTRFTLLAVIAGASACGGGSGVQTGAAASTSPARPNPDLITRAELAELSGSTARQAVERLRPRFLRTRGPSSINNTTADRVVVYIDNTRMGGVEFLEQIQVSEINEIRYLNAADATNRYGTGHTSGAIVILRR